MTDINSGEEIMIDQESWRSMVGKTLVLESKAVPGLGSIKPFSLVSVFIA